MIHRRLILRDDCSIAVNTTRNIDRQERNIDRLEQNIDRLEKMVEIIIKDNQADRERIRNLENRS
jgi:G:T-mismatch repair DNA endonuclease (very short patch repair protein)